MSACEILVACGSSFWMLTIGENMLFQLKWSFLT